MAKKKTATYREGRASRMPSSISPMLCTLTREPLNDPDYLYELKWDGYRIISHVQKGKVRMDSRSALDYTLRYPPLVKALKDLGHDVILDGEVVVFNEDGLPDFDALQLYNGHSTPISYCVFDILWLDGYDLMELPLHRRKTILLDLVKDRPIFRYSESFDDGLRLYQHSLDLNLEGIVAKRRDSPYVQGQRGNAWLKTPTRKRQEFVVGGWAESDKGRSFKSLLFGAYANGQLEWIGRSGGGYKENEMPGILKSLKALETPESPFVNKVLDTKGAKIHWVQPRLVANFEFATWTKSGRIRKPATFLGFRKDKKPAQVVREIPKAVGQVEAEVHAGNEGAKTPGRSSARRSASTASNWKKVEAVPIHDRTQLDFGECTIEVTNRDHVIWPASKTGRDLITKEQLIYYYHSVSKIILPYLKDRPQSLHIKPGTAAGNGFYIKDMEGREPECASVFSDARRHKAAGKRAKIDYLVCNNEGTLLWMINTGCIDINPWSSRISQPEEPDYIAIDLDPTVTEDGGRYTGKLMDVAMATKEFCDRQQLKAFVKTSGKTGIHFYIPCRGLSFQQARDIAEYVCHSVVGNVPSIATCAGSVKARGDKIYVDPSQNDYADTLAAPYSVRPWHLPTVSTPLEWKELSPRLDPASFTIASIAARLKKKGDLFKGLMDKKVAAANTARLVSLVL